MNLLAAQTDLVSLRDELAPILRRHGVVLLACNGQGNLIPRSDDDDWFAAMLHASPVEARLASILESSPDAEASFDLFEHVLAAALPVGHRRTKAGYLVPIAVGAPFLRSGRFEHLCQVASLDAAVVRSSLVLPSASDDLARVVGLAAELIRRTIHDRFQSHELESVGQKLSEMYEEMNLFYTIIQGMSVDQQPRRFLALVCSELLQTMHYGWIGIHISHQAKFLTEIAGRLILAEGSEINPHHVESLSARLAETAAPDEARILLPSADKDHAAYAPLGRTAIVQPIGRQGKVLGVLIAGDKHGSDDAITSVDLKLLAAAASHVAIFIENAGLYDDIQRMFMGTLEALTAAIDAKDRYTCGHSQRVALLSRQLAAALGLKDNLVQRVRIAGLVHDVGKIGVPEWVLSKAGRLSDEEFGWIRRHPEIGYRILKDIPQLRDVLPGVLHHHERWDGGGYPGGLTDTNIPEMARIIALADSFDAMSSNRTYRSARDRAWVLEEILRCSGQQFDPAFAKAFVSLDFTEYDRLVAEHRANDPITPETQEVRS